MSATLQDIKRWVGEATKDGATHLIVAVDTYDNENYPVYVTSGKNVQKEIDRIESASMQGVDEVYKMSMPIDGQLYEVRAYNI